MKRKKTGKVMKKLKALEQRMQHLQDEVIFLWQLVRKTRLENVEQLQALADRMKEMEDYIASLDVPDLPEEL